MDHLTIAVIDDDTLDRQICKKLIQLLSKDIRVLDFSNGQDALQYCYSYSDDASRLPDVIIVDIKMPLMSGWQYLDAYSVMENKLVKKPAHYVCTSSIDPKDLNSGHAYVKRHFSKPFEFDYIKQILDDVSSDAAKP